MKNQRASFGKREWWKLSTCAFCLFLASSAFAKQQIQTGIQEIQAKQTTIGIQQPAIDSLNQQLTLKTAIRKYWWLWAIILLGIAPPIFAYIKRLQNRARDNLQLAREESEWNHALDFIDEPICMVDLQDRLIRANKAYYRESGATPGEAVGEKVSRFCHTAGHDKTCPVCQARQSHSDTVITLEVDDPANRTDMALEISINPVHDNQDRPIAIIQCIRDLSHSRLAESAIRRSEAQLRGLLEATPDPLLTVNADGIILMTNRVFEKHFGYSHGEIIGKSVECLVPVAQRHNHQVLRETYTKEPTTRSKVFGLEMNCLHKKGYPIPVEISLSPMETEDGTLITVSLRDITKRLEAEKELSRLASFAEHSPIPIIEFTETGDLTYINPVAKLLFPDLKSAGGKHPLLQDILSMTAELLSNNNEMIRDIEFNSAFYEQKIIYDADHGLLRAYFWDITKIRDMSRLMAYQASHDTLTRLINRSEFEYRLKAAINELETEDKQHVLCYMDLDQFKIVNDTCGHIAGDELIKQVSSLLLTKLRENDTLARLGGDEFGLLLPNCPVNVARGIAEKLRHCIENYRFRWGDKNFKIGISIGLVPILEKGLSVAHLLSAADTACYIAKEQGRNRTHTYNKNDSVSVKHTSEMNWVHRIHQALEDSRFTLFCQQILNLGNTTQLYYEILVRMLDKDDEIISPLIFLPAAERYGLITQIDKYVIQHALEKFSASHMENINIAINLSGQTLSDYNTLNYIIELIDKYQFDARRLTFEVTETAMVANLSDAVRFISTLKGLGCRFALDDFGSGFSSFSYLKNLPVDIIKIDGGFVVGLTSDPINSVMVESMIYIGHNMNLKTVAEFVENVDTLNALQEMGIDFAQGYGIAQPIALHELQNILGGDRPAQTMNLN